MYDLRKDVDSLALWQKAMDIYFANQPQPQPQGLPKHRVGVHWIADQVRQADKDYMRTLKPPVIKIINPSADRVTEAMQWIDTAGHVALRYHPISEQQAELQSNPTQTAKNHVEYWKQQLATTYAKFPKDKIYVMGINEPTIHTAQQARTVATYNEVFTTEIGKLGYGTYLFNFSVGWPREESGRIIWDEFLYLEPLINATNSFGCVHEYGYPHLVYSGWGSYGNRVSRCPMKIKFVIGECGYTRQLAGLPQPWGWDGNISADTYAAMLWEYADKVDPGKVFAVLPFTTSFGGEEWRNKDTAKAHAAILSRKHDFVWPQPWPQYAGPPVEPPTETNPMLIIFPKFTGRITGFYGQIYNGSYAHEGMDISMPVGTPLYAPADGTVAYSATDPDYGEYIRTYHPQLDVCFFLAHLSKREVAYGNSIKQGQLLGYSGNTGNSTGPHLHFELRAMTPTGAYQVWKSGTLDLSRRNGRVDPLGWLTGWLAAGNKVEER